jgi:hypothetical protein
LKNKRGACGDKKFSSDLMLLLVENLNRYEPLLLQHALPERASLKMQQE